MANLLQAVNLATIPTGPSIPGPAASGYFNVAGALQITPSAGNGTTVTAGGLTVSAGSLTFAGATARTVTGPSTGGLTVTVASGPLSLTTTTSGTLTVTSAGAFAINGAAASTITIPATTASALNIQDASNNSYWATDTRTNQATLSAHTLGSANMSIAATANMSVHLVTNGSPTITLTTGSPTTVNSLNGLGAIFQAVPIAGGPNLTVTSASTVGIGGPPTVSGGGAITNAWSLQVASGNTVFAGNLAIGTAASVTGDALAFVSSLTGNGGVAGQQHGIYGQFTGDGTVNGEIVCQKLTWSNSAGSNTIARFGGVNIGGLGQAAGQTTTLLVAYSWDGGTIGGTNTQVNGYAVGKDDGSASVTVTGGDFVGFKVNAWSVTGSGTSNYYGLKVTAPTLATLTAAYGVYIGAIAGATTNIALQTNGGQVSLNGTAGNAGTIKIGNTTSGTAVNIIGNSASAFQVAGANLTISTSTSGTLAVTSAGLLTLTGVGASVWTPGAGATIVSDTSTGITIGTATTQKLGFWNAGPVAQQTLGHSLTNNVTSGGTTGQLDNFTSLTVYATDATAIRNDIFQLGSMLGTVTAALRLYGMLS